VRLSGSDESNARICYNICFACFGQMLNLAKTLLSIMKESLESARNIHQILIIVCTIIGIYALSITKPINEYEYFHGELRRWENSLSNLNTMKIVNGDGEVFIIGHISEYPLAQIDKILSGSVYADDANIIPNTTKSDSISRVKAVITLTDSIMKFSLQPIWNQVRDKDISSAISYLKEKSFQFKNEPKNSEVDISGLKVTADYIKYVGPFLITALLLYLSSLTEHLIRTYSGRNTEPKSFPWLGLFPDLTSRILTVASILLLPNLVILTLIWKSSLPFVSACLWTLIILLTVGSISIRIVYRLFKLQVII
jgi:hypothetical protein